MVGKRSAHPHLVTHLYVKYGRRRDTYYTIAQGKYIGLGSDREAAQRKLRDLIAGRPVAGTIAEMCQRFIAFQRELLTHSDKAALARRTIEDYDQDLKEHVLPIFGRMAPGDFK